MSLVSQEGLKLRQGTAISDLHVAEVPGTARRLPGDGILLPRREEGRSTMFWSMMFWAVLL